MAEYIDREIATKGRRMTNGDKMRQYNDLALAAVITCVNCPPNSKSKCTHEKQEACEECVMCWHRWLQQEAKA